MGSKAIITASLAILLGVLYQLILKNLIFVGFGVGRTYQTIEEFPYTCRRIQNSLLESCEKLWLDHEGRTLYAACADPETRHKWAPGGNFYNASARSLTDHVSVLNIDEPGDDGLFGLHQLDVVGDYISADGGGKNLDLHGFDVEVLPDSRLRFWMINHRPPTDISGNQLDAVKLGANSTVEVFELTRGSSEWEYVKTVVSDAIETPNDLAIVGDGQFLATNDHNAKVGPLRDFEILYGGGSVTFCGSDDQCHIAAAKGFRFANGIVKGNDGLYYVASTVTGKVSVHFLEANQTLTKVHEIDLGMPVDNLSVDADGSIFAAAFPNVVAMAKAAGAPRTSDVPSTIFRIRKLINDQGEPEYEVTKALEDIEGRVLPGSTTAVHDVKTGRFFLAAVSSTFLTICDPQS